MFLFDVTWYIRVSEYDHDVGLLPWIYKRFGDSLVKIQLLRACSVNYIAANERACYTARILSSQWMFAHFKFVSVAGHCACHRFVAGTNFVESLFSLQRFLEFCWIGKFGFSATNQQTRNPSATRSVWNHCKPIGRLFYASKNKPSNLDSNPNESSITFRSQHKNRIAKRGEGARKNPTVVILWGLV